MQSIKFFRKKTKSFLKSIDTITTKLLMLVLFVITIPLMVIGNFSTDIINQNNKENSDNQVALNKMIFEQQYQAENNRLKFLAQNSIERIISEKSSKKEILEELQKNYDLSFCVILLKNNNFLAKAGQINKKDIKKEPLIIIGNWSISYQMRNMISSPCLGLKRLLNNNFKGYIHDKMLEISYKNEFNIEEINSDKNQ